MHEFSLVPYLRGWGNNRHHAGVCHCNNCKQMSHKEDSQICLDDKILGIIKIIFSKPLSLRFSFKIIDQLKSEHSPLPPPDWWGPWPSEKIRSNIVFRFAFSSVFCVRPYPIGASSNRRVKKRVVVHILAYKITDRKVTYILKSVLDKTALSPESVMELRRCRKRFKYTRKQLIKWRNKVTEKLVLGLNQNSNAFINIEFVTGFFDVPERLSRSVSERLSLHNWPEFSWRPNFPPGFEVIGTANNCTAILAITKRRVLLGEPTLLVRLNLCEINGNIVTISEDETCLFGFFFWRTSFVHWAPANFDVQWCLSHASLFRGHRGPRYNR